MSSTSDPPENRDSHQPDHPLTLALRHHRSGRFAEAEEIYLGILEQQPGDADALHLLGVLRYQFGRLEEAKQMLQQATAAAPGHVEALCNLGSVLLATGDLQEAEAMLERAISLDESQPAALNTLGNVRMAQGRLPDSIDCYERAIELATDFVEAHVNLANAWLLSGRPDAARPACASALRLQPRLAPAHQMMGNILATLDDHEAATRCFREAVRLDPDSADHLCGLAASLESERKWDEALPCFDRALELDPNHGPAISGALLLRKSLCLWDDIDAASQRFSQGVGAGLAGLTPFVYLAEPSSAMEELACARLWSRHIEERVSAIKQRLALKPAAQRGDKITVGYFSHDFRRHPTAYTKVGLFENHDRTRFRVLGYCNGPDDQSDIRRRVIDSFDEFSDVSGWPAEDVARKIHADGVDILVDLKGHTLEAPTEVFALKPAPIQVNYKGYPGTMGAGFIDYIVADEFVVPPEARESCAEKVVYLPETYWVDDSRRALPAQPSPRGQLGLPEDGFVFCGFNNSYKIRPEIFAAWMSILKNVNGSVLWLQDSNPNSSLSSNLRREAQKRGVSGDRIVFAPRLPLRQYLGLFLAADLFLDTRPYNGHTTASDALWTGLPVLTCPGETFASRVAGSLLRTLGLDSLIASSMDSYVEIASRLARAPSELKSIEDRLEAGKTTSPLYDTARLTRHMEDAFEHMVRIYMSGEPPCGFAVSPRTR